MYMKYQNAFSNDCFLVIFQTTLTEVQFGPMKLIKDPLQVLFMCKCSENTSAIAQTCFNETSLFLRNLHHRFKLDESGKPFSVHVCR